MTPRATYRLQFHAGFTFADAAPLAPYLAGLGISHVYASPIGTARAGSTHGYDVVDPTTVNPELGGEEAFRALVAALRAEGLGVILDIVPNHMAVGGADNRWWLDVLENGEASAHAEFFDIDWRPADPALQGKVLAPFLGRPYADALAAGDIRLEARDGRPVVLAHGAHLFPIRPQDRDEVLSAGPAAFDPSSEGGRARLHALLERQNFRLAWWRTAGDEINWRRFFDITELAGVRIDRPEVFETVHALPLRLYAEGLIDGLRIDHVDGLAEPGAYCRRLRARLAELEGRRPPAAPGGPAYLIVEKILAPEERLDPAWLCDGTSGYDYMNEVAALLHDPAGEGPLTRLWAELSGRSPDFGEEERAARREILTQGFAGQLEAAARAFHRLARADLTTRDLSFGALRRALIALLSVFPAYRTYGDGREPCAGDAPLVREAAARARAACHAADLPALEALLAWLGGEGRVGAADPKDAVRRLQQLSAPVAAKAVEDTAFYRYGRLLSRNDVGFDPDRLSAPAGHFHAANAERARAFPAAMLATATHDHKRGEDVRARLATLSERPEEWARQAAGWRAMNGAEGAGVEAADEYQIYQTLVGAWPLAEPELEDFPGRIAAWLEKSLREAKLRSSWLAPNQAYEDAARRFLARLLEEPAGRDFRESLAAFVDRIAPAAALTGLSQAFLKCASPGVPDIYQGAEFWDLSLVDPDNRRPVDFSARAAALGEDRPPAELMSSWRTGAVKQAVIARTLRARATHAHAFASGDYLPLQACGARAGSVVGFARRSGGALVIAAAAIRCAGAVEGRDRPLPEPDWWGDTCLLAPEDLPREADDALDAGRRPLERELHARDLFAPLPVALLVAQA